MQSDQPPVQAMDWLQAHQILEAAIRALIRRQPRSPDDAAADPAKISEAVQLARGAPQLLQLIGLAAVNAVDNDLNGKECGSTGLTAMQALVRQMEWEDGQLII